ncbi:FAD-binding oxidoreductase [Jatrophihabitans endophyticus]|uniref:NAD(P)/FAD-dependent oxidoreductase n=1 Tax=Jatrophihabitans endophyticus TaxID=1206085 RepID=UPI0019E05823|nr:FAD-dependent oxidoreductase [Jatrophihabitans endophyticus]MBE7187412.1 FAD-binding oxidoreductase [Jatrophihabitans endophyticus]
MNSTADVAVVGAGVIGASIALELARAGRDVLVLDKAGGAGHGSTSASSAIIRFTYSTFDAVALSWEAKFCWQAWAEHLGVRDPSGTAAFHRTGMLTLDVELMPRARMLDLFDRVGVPYEQFDAEQLVRRFPHLDNGRYWPNKPVSDDAFWADATGTLGGVFTPDAGFVDDPGLAAQNLAAAAAAHGARFAFHTAVSAVHQKPAGGWRLELADGSSVDCAAVVNAAGPWSGALNRLAGVGAEFTVGVRPLRQEVHEVRAPAGYGDSYSHDDGVGGTGPAFADLDLGTYVRPSVHGTLFVGGTEPECDPLEWLDDPDDCDPRVTAERHEAQVSRAARRLPGLGVPNRRTGIAGVYDASDDWMPIYDRTDAPGWYVAMGTSGNQFKNAPVVGRLMATLIEQVESGHDHDAAPVRCTMAHTGAVVDLGTFSRMRKRNEASSGTVMG